MLLKFAKQLLIQPTCPRRWCLPSFQMLIFLSCEKKSKLPLSRQRHISATAITQIPFPYSLEIKGEIGKMKSHDGSIIFPLFSSCRSNFPPFSLHLHVFVFLRFLCNLRFTTSFWNHLHQMGNSFRLFF